MVNSLQVTKNTQTFVTGEKHPVADTMETAHLNIDTKQKINLLEKERDQLLELNSIKNKLFSVIAHDLRTPMYGLKNLFNSIQKNSISNEAFLQLLPDVVNNINHTTSLMENLLLWSKSQMDGFTVKEELMDVYEVVAEAEKLLTQHAKSKDICISISIGNPIHIFADRDMISLIVRNLLSNAIKFTPVNGKVEIIIAEEENNIKVYVKDNGLGISKDKLSVLFDNNYSSTKGTASEMGTGLGLVLCKEFVQKNGGTIAVESKEGQGSTFSVSLQNNNFCYLYLEK